MQSNLRIALRVIGMALFTSFLCLFVQVSFHTMMKSFSTEVIGYNVYQVYEDGTNKELGYIEKTEKPDNPQDDMRYMAVYSEMPQSAKVVEAVLSAVCSLGILFCTTGTTFAKVAAKDRNDCDFNGIEHDKSRGLKIGTLAAVIPAIYWASMLALSFMPQNTSINWLYWVYRFVIMGPVKPINDIILSSVFSGANQDYTYDLSVAPTWFIAFHIVYILLFIAYSYAMYRLCYNEDSVLAKLLYKSTRKEDNVRRLGGR